MNADGSAQRKLSRGATPSWSPDGRLIAFGRKVGGTEHIYVMNAEGTRARPLTKGGTRGALPDWQPIVVR